VCVCVFFCSFWHSPLLSSLTPRPHAFYITETAQLTEQDQKDRKPVRGYVDGCFDIMHSGHYNAIRQAKMLCDVLVVGVHSDAEIIRSKGPPVMNNEERLATVKACKWVDEVVFDTPYDPSIELLDKLNCDFSIHGDDTSTTADGEDAYAAVRQAGRLRVIKRTAGVSTTDLVGRLLLMTKTHHVPSVHNDDPAASPAAQVLSPISAASPYVSRLSITGSPNRAASPPGTEPPSLDLAGANAATGSADAAPVETKVTISSPRQDAQQHYASGVSSGFLPTTWRIAQFSNHKTPTQDDKVVYIDGSFDLFHIGHIETLKQAKELGTFLYVGIHDDQTVNRHKGRNYPIMNLHERVLNVLSCTCVDEVVIGAPWEMTEDLIKVLGVDIVVSGSNTKLGPGDSVDEKDPHIVPKQLGIFREVPTTHLLSTDDVVKRIIENRLKYQNRNKSRSAKELDYLKKREYVQEI
jgi:ethanolamine-phosphate cytidylyltransferase